MEDTPEPVVIPNWVWAVVALIVLGGVILAVATRSRSGDHGHRSSRSSRRRHRSSRRHRDDGDDPFAKY